MTIATEEDILKIMSMGAGKNDWAIITLLLSSGLPSKFIEELTYEQLLDACDSYFKYDELKTIHNLVKKNPKNDGYIACFDLKMKSRPRMTCCSPESLQLTIEYLRYRKNLNIDSDKDYVFLNHHNEPMAGKDHISYIFRRAREKASNYLPNDESLDIKSEYVRNRFKDICKNHLRGSYRDEVLLLLNGSGTANNKRFYEHVKDDRYLLIDHYKTVVDYLTLGSTNNELNHTINNFTTNMRY
ncbi:hypothetical protein [Methanobrevibacter sp.]|uniref:hypothetical protein n=1 Tax=Methanobrevibacter sp. TaxID=66852 RepID=UPI00386D542C